MFAKTSRVVLVAAAAIAASGVIALAATAIKVTPAAITAVAVAKTPQPYRLDGFKGWSAGYPVSYEACRPTLSRKLDTCGPQRLPHRPELQDQI